MNCVNCHQDLTIVPYCALKNNRYECLDSQTCRQRKQSDIKIKIFENTNLRKKLAKELKLNPTTELCKEYLNIIQTLINLKDKSIKFESTGMRNMSNDFYDDFTGARFITVFNQIKNMRLGRIDIDVE